jgi:dTDP-glucose pyrophosphorylase
MNILIPMAGAGKRFQDAGYKKPKPLIDVFGQPMIERVLNSLSDSRVETNFIFVAQQDHLKLGLSDYLNDKGTVIAIDGMTEGAACTTLLAQEHIDNDSELIIANCDQYMQWDFCDFTTYCQLFDGCLATFNSTNPHHSYARAVHRRVVEVAEKIVISDKASAGIYYFKRGSDYVHAAIQMIDKNIRTNNEFYICPVYNELLEDNRNISIYEIDAYGKHMLGTPEELAVFVEKVTNKEITLDN